MSPHLRTTLSDLTALLEHLRAELCARPRFDENAELLRVSVQLAFLDWQIRGMLDGDRNDQFLWFWLNYYTTPQQLAEIRMGLSQLEEIARSLSPADPLSGRFDGLAARVPVLH
jgi:hypothetical protein